jgi:outer membrane protein OmpA-like peptidoglycan-associated protein
VIAVSEIQMQGGNAPVCAGTPVNLSVTNKSTFPVRFQWTLNGTATGADQPNLTFTPGDAGGPQNVSIQVTDVSGRTPGGAQPVTRNITVQGRPYVRPTIQAKTPGEVPRNGTATVNAAAQGDCGGALTYTWTASEGTITPAPGNPLQATFNPQSVAFGPVSDRDEVRQVTLTATVRDARGATASTNIPVTVRRAAELVRFPDILFTAGSSRVNNCGQRILLEEVFPRVRSGNFTVVLVGHVDAAERTANLDRERAYSAARVLVAGADTQVRVEADRVKADWVGTAQNAPKLPGYCGTSTRPTVREIQGATIQENAAAENRRVEVWLVPAGLQLPATIAAPKDLPATIRPR